MAKDLSLKLALKDLFGRGLALPQIQNKGTRILTSRMGTRDNSGGGLGMTYHVALTLAQHFDAVRLILANTSTNLAMGSYVAKVSVISSFANDTAINNSAGTWQTVTMEGNTALSIPTADETEVTEYAFSDWIALQSIPRTDGGTLPGLAIRMRGVSLATIACYGNGTDDFTSWTSHASGRLWFAREQSGDHLTTTTGFNSTTNTSQSPIVGVQYISRGKVVTVMGDGDSITDGRGGVLAEGFIFPACVRLSDINDIAIEYANLGWSGQIYQKFYKRGMNALLSDLAPDILVIPAGSPNDISTTITNTHIANFALWRQHITNQCLDIGVKPVIWTMLPSNTAVKAYGASDSLRVAYNAQVISLATKDLTVVDLATPISGVTSGGQVQMLVGAQDDGIHPNTTGNQLLSTFIEPAIAKLMRYPSRRIGKRSMGKPLPTYTITGGSITMSRSGFYMFAGGSAANMSFSTIVPQIYKREPLYCHVLNRGSANIPITSTAQFSINGIIQTGITLYPGQSCLLVYDGNNISALYGDFPSTTQSFAPLTGTTVAPINNRGAMIIARIKPAGTLAALTITFPPTPYSGQQFRFSTSQAITALTTSAPGTTIVGAPSSLSAEACFTFQYDIVGTTWFKVS